MPSYDKESESEKRAEKLRRKLKKLEDSKANGINGRVVITKRKKNKDDNISIDSLAKVINSLVEQKEVKKITTKTSETTETTETTKASESVPTLTQQNSDIKKEDIPLTLKEKELKPVMVIPAGTKVCPLERVTISTLTDYYITLDQEITLCLDEVVTVNINGSMFNVIVPNLCENNYKKFQSFLVPKNTIYHVNDSTKDPIGLSHRLEVDIRVKICPGSQVYLDSGSTVMIPNTEHKLSSMAQATHSFECVGIGCEAPGCIAIKNLSVMSCINEERHKAETNVYMTLKHKTKCLV